MATPAPQHNDNVSRDDVAPSGPSQSSAGLPPSETGLKDNAPAVRFSSAVEEIDPQTPVTSGDAIVSPGPAGEVTADQLKAFTKSLHGRPLQERRMNTFQFEAFSLPPSRVPSREDESGENSRLTTPKSPAFQSSPHGSPRLSAMTSPPLTPAGSDPTGSSDRKSRLSANEPQPITPQPSTSQEKEGSTRASHRQPLTHRPASSDHVLQRAASAENEREEQYSHRRGMFGAGAGSVPVSRESSPSRSSASNFYSKPMTPGGDANDPYAKGRRPAQHHARHTIDPRFVFSKKKHKHVSPSSSKTSLNEKRSSGKFGRGDDLSPSNTGSTTHHQHASHGSMSDLKRFFRKGGHHKKREASPAPSTKSGTKTPPAARSQPQLPFGDDHGLSSKYGKLGKILGSGAGGSVRLMKRKEDNTVFAVKEFRARHTYETEKEYNKKVTAEFCVGSTLHHGNIIETLDILQEKGRWFEVMEYAPFDLFAIVMTGRMTRAEVTCCFLQILNGVTYLHSLGLAHRDLKLDNVVVSDKGIMKIIDFGSAHVFKYPFETDVVPAKGIVGSDPYLAPEVYDSKEYDAAAVDIWSLAIIYCCMTLRRFPWKIPRMTDNSYKLFASDPTPGHDPDQLVSANRNQTDQSHNTNGSTEKEQGKEGNSHRRHARDASVATVHQERETTQSSNTHSTGEKKEVIKGPWRILRLLPRESRFIIHRMLDLNPQSRAKMDEILAEPWIADTIICQQLENGEVMPADDHTHVLEPPASQKEPQSSK